MGIHVLAVYRPKPGRTSQLEAEVAGHVQLLRRLGLATERPSIALRAPDGTVVEYFEWVSREALNSAHSHSEVLEMWDRFAECCEYVGLDDLSNADTLFPEFEFMGSF